jgi:histidine phosphotransfer protein HptB
LKSNASTFGASALAEASRKLELNGLPADDAPLQALAAELTLVAAALRQLQQGTSDG